MQIHSIPFANPEAFESGVEPVAGSVRTRPIHGSKLRGKVRVADLQKIGFLTIDSDPMTTRIDRAAGFYGLTITRGTPFEISDEGRTRTFNRDSAHLLTPDKAFNFRAIDGASILGTNFFVDNLQEWAYQLNGGRDTFRLPEDSRVSLARPAGASLVRYLTFIWGELNHGGGILTSDLAAKEIEDGLIAALVMAINETVANSEPGRLDRAHAGMSRAEEYLLAHLCDPVSRTELAQIAGVSIRTLSRAFLRCHGMGPMAFLKLHRLDAARRDLLLGEPGKTRITDIALRYGFGQPSKFSADYNAAFNETPSDTLFRL